MKMRMRQLVASAAAVLVCALAAPAAASADSVGVNVYWEAVLGPSNTIIVDYQCQVGALPVAASVSIRCGIRRFGGGAAPGSVWFHTDGEQLPNQPFSICWTGTATFLSGKVLTTGDCTPPQVNPFGHGSSSKQG